MHGVDVLVGSQQTVIRDVIADHAASDQVSYPFLPSPPLFLWCPMPFCLPINWLTKSLQNLTLSTILPGEMCVTPAPFVEDRSVRASRRRGPLKSDTSAQIWMRTVYLSGSGADRSIPSKRKKIFKKKLKKKPMGNISLALSCLPPLAALCQACKA